jgi:hypothetical protein
MNERMHQLQIAAMRSVWDGSDPDGDVDKMYIPAEFAKKFANLIVEECVRFLKEDYQRDFDTLWREDLSKGIKEHFGVER